MKFEMPNTSEGFIDFDPQKVPSVLRPETPKTNIFLEQTQSIETLKQKLITKTGEIGTLKGRMREPNYLMSKEDVARLGQLGFEKDEIINEIERRSNLSKPTIENNLTGRDQRAAKYN